MREAAEAGSIPKRPRSTTLVLVALWFAFYGSFTLWTPALLDDADSVHAEVAREMLLRHDYVTLYANGIRYLEKAPVLYWAMAGSMRVAQMTGYRGPRALAAAARVPLALAVLVLAFALESFARRASGGNPGGAMGARAGLYAGVMLLSCPGIFLFTRILLPDTMLCLWLALAILCFWLTEQDVRAPHLTPTRRDKTRMRLLCYAFAACCSLGVLTKGLIGAVFPLGIVVVYLAVTRGPGGAARRMDQLHPVSSLAIFLMTAAPWHILIALANLSRGRPGEITLTHGHFSVPLPTDGNVHGWAWFYFVNEQALRYLNLRVPRDYDTVPLWLFWGLCLIWLMPWSGFLFTAVSRAVPLRNSGWRERLRTRGLSREESTLLLMAVWAALPMVFFSFSTRQEYYMLPSLPAFVLLISAAMAKAGRFRRAEDTSAVKGGTVTVRCSIGKSEAAGVIRDGVAAERIAAVVLGFGAMFAGAALVFLAHSRAPAAGVDLAALLRHNPGDYAMSMGHFLDLNSQALGLFRLPLATAAICVFLSALASYVLRRKGHPHAAVMAWSAGAFGFLLAVHLALQTFAPVLSSAQLAAAIAPQLRADDLIVIHQEYEYGSTLGFYLQRPSYTVADGDRAIAVDPIHILEGRSSNLWYGSFFPDAPAIFETADSLALRWPRPQRIFLWQDLGNQPGALPHLPGPVYVIARSGGKEIVSNQENSPAGSR